MLFGTNDLNDCDENNSIWGAPAYLADVLRFLGTHRAEDQENVTGTYIGSMPIEAPGTVLGVLFERRPDLQKIKLNRENTETTLPYIDLVCEVLERAVLQVRDATMVHAGDFDLQTTWDSGELRAFPEHVRTAAYDFLRSATYPMDASFDLWQEEARAWLGHLGVPRHELMALLQPGGDQPTPPNTSIAAEYFGISSGELDIICTPKPLDDDQKDFWGFTESPSSFSDIYVRDFLERSKLEYMELLQLKQVKWLSSGVVVPFEITPVGCLDLSQQKLGILSLERLDRIHRFLRLWRKTDWKMWELDLLIRAPAIGNGALDANLVVKLYQFKRVQQCLGLSCEEALALFDGAGNEINQEPRTEPDNPLKEIQPLYKRLFESRDGTRLKSYNLHDTENRPALRAALKVSEEDLTLLLSWIGASGPARLYGYAVIARGLSLSIKELFQLMMLAQIQSFTNPQELLDFIELRDQVSASGLKIDELEFILRHSPNALNAVRDTSVHALRDESIVRMIEELRETLWTASNDIAEQNAKLVDKVAALFELTSERARLLLDKLFLETISLRDTLSDASLLSRDSEDPNQYTAINRQQFPTQIKAIELLHKVNFLLVRQSIASTEDFDWLITNECGLLRLADLPVEDLPSDERLTQWVAFTNWRALVEQFPEPEGASWREVIEEASQLDASGYIPEEFWRKFAALMQWPVEHYESFEEFKALGLAAGIGKDSAPVDACCRLVKAMKAVRRLGISATVALNWIDRDAEGQEAIASQIRDTAKSKYDALTWLEKAAPIQNELREKKRTALCRFLVEHSLRNESPTITIKDRDQACPTGRNPKYWTDTNDLIRYFLLDVEMGADQLTSRIKQAMSSVQMFVQRCFLNLERPLIQVSSKEKKDTDSPNSWNQWQYLKSYRMWQAARKILFYPENWIEPELRPNKSPFFEELESELAKDEVTQEHVEDCFRHFMEKVHEVSRLDVVGVYHEVGADKDDLRDLLHVVARTKADPAIFYYRSFDGIDSTWSPWEKIDADITGEHVHPVVYNRKLYLFWLVFLEKPQKTYKQPPAKASDKATDSPETPKQLEIQLA